MIEHVPAADELRIVSLRLYFKAWADISEIITEWEQFGQNGSSDWTKDEEGDSITPEDSLRSSGVSDWEDYVAAAQSDLQAIYALIQQSQEIGLKARICDVSAYLLLKRTDIKPADATTGTWDFSDFPTIDAAELVRVHDIFCSNALSKDFARRYDEIRRNRNKIFHLGIYRKNIDPEHIIDILQIHYSELYPGRRWMDDRLHFATLGRWANYVDNDFNERTGLFEELSQLLPALSDSQFKWLMQHDRDETRYVCHWCIDDANFQGFGDMRTAYRIEDNFKVRCIVCNGIYAMKPSDCARDSCECKLVSAEIESQGACMQCGWTAKDVEDEELRRKY